MSAKQKFYSLLVNRKPVIKARYEYNVIQNRKKHSKNPLSSWFFLLGLNIDYYILGDKNLDKVQKKQKPKQFTGNSESTLSYKQPPSQLAESLCKFDVISFDIFDTLIFRPFKAPTDLFYIVGEKLKYPDFRRLRILAEQTAREEKRKQKGITEITIEDIYNTLAEMTGLDKDTAIKVELETELELCYANPYMKQVFDIIAKNDKKIIIISDMYLTDSFMSKLLDKNGFLGYNNLFVSCTYGFSKNNGKLYAEVKKQLGGQLSYAHVGDNVHSDIIMAEKNGFTAFEYENINEKGNSYRAEMSPITGSYWAGIVNAKFHCGLGKYSPQYEYGYAYAGILVVGYCNFIHELAKKQGADKILFFSRDGYIIKKIYNKLYPQDKTEYAYWSRSAATKLGAEHFRYDYFNRFITQKAGHNFTFSDILKSMGIEQLLLKNFLDINPDEILTNRNEFKLQEQLQAVFSQILDCYRDEQTAAKQYYKQLIGDSKSVLTVDCGWAGSGSIVLDWLFEKWQLDCKVSGALIGTNGKYQANNDSSDTFLQSGKLASYCFSDCHNTDLFKLHNAAQNHNIYMEMMFTAPEPSLKGFALENNKVKLIFDKDTENLTAIQEIHNGIVDFAEEMVERFASSTFDFVMNISGKDAYSPFESAIYGECKFIKHVMKDCTIDSLTGGNK